MKLSESLLLITKKVIRGAVGLGIEEAGARICGPTAWKYMKAALTPAFNELEHRFPKVFLVPEEAEKAIKTLSSEKVFEEMISNGFISLESGQQEILALLAGQNETLTVIGKNVDTGFEQLGKKADTLQTALDYLVGKLNELNYKVEDIVTSKGVKPPPSAPGVSPGQIYSHVFACQSDAQRWMESGDTETASKRLAEGRTLAEAGLQKFPDNASLLVALGYIEKTQAQVAQLQSNFEEYVNYLEKAAKCFANVLCSDPDNAGALNGMANVYFYHQDYDRAVKFGSMAVDRDPDYGAASWDLALALENKLIESEPDQSLTKKLKATYLHLQALMPHQPQVFTANDLVYVTDRLNALQHL